MEETIIITLVLVGIAVAILPAIFYLLTLSKALKLCSPNNQRIPPGQVWLVFIPLFGIVWHFLLVGYVADSLADEFRQRNYQVDEQRPGFGIGITFLILGLCGAIPLLGILTSLASLVCWIIYWVKIAGYNKMLENHNAMFSPATNLPPRV